MFILILIEISPYSKTIFSLDFPDSAFNVQSLPASAHSFCLPLKSLRARNPISLRAQRKQTERANKDRTDKQTFRHQTTTPGSLPEQESGTSPKRNIFTLKSRWFFCCCASRKRTKERHAWLLF